MIYLALASLCLMAFAFGYEVGFDSGRKVTGHGPRKDKRRKPRWLQKIIARWGGYFWLPCPVCGEYFGGHEWAGDLYLGWGQGEGVCANCVERAAELSELGYAGDRAVMG